MNVINVSALEAHVAEIMENEQIAGVAIAVSQNGNTLYEKGFGVRNIATGDPVTPDTVFGIGSVTKSFTALAIMKLAQEGKLSLHDPVQKHLPDWKLQGLEDQRTVTIHHLLTHTTGLPPMRRREDLNRFDEHLTYLGSAEYALLGQPGEYFSYCNDTFLLLGAIIERLTGRLYRRYVTEEILARLQMHRSTFSLEELAKLSNVTIPYVKNAVNNQLEAVNWSKLGNYEVGGGIRSTVRDLITYGQALLGQGTTVVGAGVANEMWRPHHQIDRNSFYGYALESVPDHAGITLVEHGGSQPGVSSHFGLVPEKGLVVAVLTNVSDVSADAIWLATVNAALGLPLEQKSSVQPTYEASLEELQRLMGTYHSAEGGRVRFFLDRELPKAISGNAEFSLRATDSHTLVVEGKNFPIRFFFKEGKQAWAVRIGVRMWTRTTDEA
ncbi:class A beta-lactamase-related serine hydrolase [Brevibacillus fluminis]|uniref:Class A beta-lactamase-related serine hydrolase n=1 Tax=Brevibacillus fluminis TaxID=511487 RepID=A0A3M8CZL2_9BACL|nr:serine hydrolase domain-containing protein [Brevibacillus fluminis]RNB81244.1 class A beta-lactamase-related serine hydrolase [Brevibacillus fluminis]